MMRMEWRTVAVAALCYLVWCVGLSGMAPLWAAIPMLALSITLHSSLSHEVIHGHPFGASWANEALVFPALGLLVPYERFRDLHLAHHQDARLTDPYDDPESAYLNPATWKRLPRLVRWVLELNNCMVGRVALGVVISQVVFIVSEAQAWREAAVRRAWLLHGIGVALVMAVVWASGFPVWAYLLAVYLGNALLRVRIFVEHQAHERASGRTVVIEDRGIWAFLFLNNNFHAVHHIHPELPWYALPERYFADREGYLRRNQAYVYPGYWAVARQYGLKAKEPVAHPHYPQ